MILEIKDYGENTLWEIITNTLIEHNIDVYPPATAKGECKKPYVVLKQDGATKIPGLSSEKVFYMFMLYVPKEQYTYLSRFEEEVRNALEDIIPMILPVGETNTDYYDDNYNAHMRYMLYRANRRNKYV